MRCAGKPSAVLVIAVVTERAIGDFAQLRIVLKVYAVHKDVGYQSDAVTMI